jgi:hypothetical protein
MLGTFNTYAEKFTFENVHFQFSNLKIGVSPCQSLPVSESKAISFFGASFLRNYCCQLFKMLGPDQRKSAFT